MKGYKRMFNSKCITVIGENVTDIILYIMRICSCNYSFLLYDLSSSRNIIDLIAPSGNPSIQEFRYNVYDSIHKEIEDSYDLVITYSDKLQNIPEKLLHGHIYFFLKPEKLSINRFFKDMITLEPYLNSLFVVCRGFFDSDTIIKRMFLSGVSPYILNNMIFICDSVNDRTVLWWMKYNSVFLFDNLSKDLRGFLVTFYNRINDMFDVTLLPDVSRYKWVM